MTAIAAVLGAVLAIYLAGPRLSAYAEHLADRFGIQHALGGAVFLGMTTSLSGTVVSVTAAARGDASLAISNGLGGIAAQTVFLAIADFFHRRANLEHDAVSVANIFQGCLLVLLLGSVMVAFTGPEFSLLGVHPVSILLPLLWAGGTLLAYRTGESSPWTVPVKPRPAARHAPDAGDSPARTRSLGAVLPRFVLFALVVGGAGFALSRYTPSLTDRMGLSRSAAGFLITATATSLPELVTTVAAVRRGALTLAVGNIVGGNAFDILFCSLSDAVYRDGSIYHAVSGNERLVASLGIVMSTLLLLGLVGRERHGIARIGTESLLMILTYILGVVLIVANQNGPDAPGQGERPDGPNARPRAPAPSPRQDRPVMER